MRWFELSLLEDSTSGWKAKQIKKAPEISPQKEAPKRAYRKSLPKVACCAMLQG